LLRSPAKARVNTNRRRPPLTWPALARLRGSTGVCTASKIGALRRLALGSMGPCTRNWCRRMAPHYCASRVTPQPQDPCGFAVRPWSGPGRDPSSLQIRTFRRPWSAPGLHRIARIARLARFRRRRRCAGGRRPSRREVRPATDASVDRIAPAAGHGEAGDEQQHVHLASASVTGRARPPPPPRACERGASRPRAPARS